MVEFNVMKSKKEMDGSMTETFIKENRVKANNNVVVCGDGRYLPEEKRGGIGIFGADLGFILAIRGVLNEKGIKLSTKDLVSKYLSAVKEIRENKEEKIYYHTDTHNEIGCGHMAKACTEEYFKKYQNLNNQDAREIWDEAESLGKEDVEKLVLKGDHKEKGVLFVYGQDKKLPLWTVDSYNPKKDQENMYFIVDMARGEDLANKLSRNIKIDNLTGEEIWLSYLKHMGATAEILAKNLPQFEVKFDQEGNFSTQFLGNI